MEVGHISRETVFRAILYLKCVVFDSGQLGPICSGEFHGCRLRVDVHQIPDSYEFAGKLFV